MKQVKAENKNVLICPHCGELVDETTQCANCLEPIDLNDFCCHEEHDVRCSMLGNHLCKKCGKEELNTSEVNL